MQLYLHFLFISGLFFPFSSPSWLSTLPCATHFYGIPAKEVSERNYPSFVSEYKIFALTLHFQSGQNQKTNNITHGFKIILQRELRSILLV